LLERCLRFADPAQPTLPKLKLRVDLVSRLAWSVLGVFLRVGFLSTPHQGLDLRLEALLLFLHPAVAHRLVLARIRLHLRAVERDVAYGLQSRPSA
jgi:hypothetical protein